MRSRQRLHLRGQGWAWRHWPDARDAVPKLACKKHVRSSHQAGRRRPDQRAEPFGGMVDAVPAATLKARGRATGRRAQRCIDDGNSEENVQERLALSKYIARLVALILVVTALPASAKGTDFVSRTYDQNQAGCAT